MARRSDEQGAAAVEFALIVPVFLMLVMGLISSGLAFNRWNTLSHSSREGGRHGATLAMESTSGVPDAWLDDVTHVAVTSAAGQLGASTKGRYACIAYIGFEPRQNSTSDWSRKRIESGSAVSYTSASVNTPSSWCYDDGRGSSGDDRRVQVVVGMETTFSIVFWANTFQQTSESVSRFEAVAPI